MGDGVKGAGDELDSICSELDGLSLHMLYLMKEYIDCKVNIEDLIKNGSLHLAKSRYIMGNRSVSALQLPTEDRCEVTAQTTLLSSRARSGSIESITYELSRLAVNDSIKSSDGLKSRSKTDKPKSNDEKNSVQDPLKWFGVLVPQNLRHAQSCFNKAIDLVVQCVNVQLEMEQTRKKFDKFVARKKKLTQQHTREDKNT